MKEGSRRFGALTGRDSSWSGASGARKVAEEAPANSPLLGAPVVCERVRILSSFFIRACAAALRRLSCRPMARMVLPIRRQLNSRAPVSQFPKSSLSMLRTGWRVDRDSELFRDLVTRGQEFRK